MNRIADERVYSVEHAALSDVGLSRSNNQDSLLITDGDGSKGTPGYLLVVADGMGAHAAGEVASRIAVDTVEEVYRAGTGGKPEEALHEALRAANAEIHRQGLESDELRGMGTTLSSLVLLPQEALIGHVGDSRIYRLRGNTLEQLTFDHSLVWEICAVENIMETEVPAFVPRNIVTRSVGPTPEVDIDLEGPFSLRTGDTYLLCSDGLTGQVDDEELGTILQCFGPDEAALVLVDLANLRGGPDNVTVVVARVNRWKMTGGTKTGKFRRRRSTSLAARIFRPLLAAAGLFAVGWMFRGPVAAIVAAAVGALLVALIDRLLCQAEPPSVAPLGDRQRLGRAPYITCDCTVNERSVHCMAKAIEEIRDVAVNRLWHVDWDQFEGLVAAAEEAGKSGDFAESVAVYGKVVRFMRTQLQKTLADDE